MLFQLHMVFWDNTNYQSYELAAKGEDGLAVVAVLYEVRWANCGNCVDLAIRFYDVWKAKAFPDFPPSPPPPFFSLFHFFNYYFLFSLF